MADRANFALQRNSMLDDFVGTVGANTGLAVFAELVQNKTLQRTNATTAAVTL